jgi:TIR domain
MAEGDGGAGPGTGPGWRWDVALSFAGAQRDYVEQVARALKEQGVRCFYDADEQIELWGRYLAEELPAIYGEQAAAVVVFVSAEYAARDWTRHERRAALARAVRERREYVLPGRFDDTPLPGLPPDMGWVDLRPKTPQQFAAMIAAKLADLSIISAAPAESPAQDARAARPAGAVRVTQADPRQLGVHAAISVPGVHDDVLPEYVPRDTDVGGQGVRDRVAAAAARGGFVLLVGGSSVGKTRCAAEAVRALLPDWWLVHPAGPGEVAALAAASAARTVVWLDELQRYLDGEHGLTGGVMRALLGAPGPVAIIGTLWPDRYTAYTAVPSSGGADPHAREREVLDLAVVVRIGAAFSPAEQDRARAAAAGDQRLALALGAGGYGLTQTLAAAPQLVARWQDAQAANPYAWAVMTAAMDAARLGARAPLPAGLLRAAAPGYCTSAQQAEAPNGWFEQALAYATEKLHGAAAALAPGGAGMGQIAGYTVADYLIQHASRERRYARLPASTWDAVVSYIRDPADATRLADSARDRLLYRYAIPLYRYAADAGHGWGASRLVALLEERGDLDGAVQVLRTAADTGGGWAAKRLAVLLEERGDLDGAVQVLRTAADTGDYAAAERLADLLASRGDLDGLRTRAEAGDGVAAVRLAVLLEERGDLDGAVQVLRTLADAGGDHAAAERLAFLLEERGDLDGAAQALRTAADGGDHAAAERLVALLEERGDLDGAAQALRTAADTGDHAAARNLAALLASRGDLDGLRTLADTGDHAAARKLAALLYKRGDPDGAAQALRTAADTGDHAAARRLAALLRKRGDPDAAAQALAYAGDLERLRGLADVGDHAAARRLAALLRKRGDPDGAAQLWRRGDPDEAAQALRALADAGDIIAARRLGNLLRKRGDLDGAAQALRTAADTGDIIAALRLVALLEERGDLDGAAQALRTAADAGNQYAADKLAALLYEQGDLDGLRARADTGDHAAARKLAALLAGRGDLDGLRAQAVAGNPWAAPELAVLLYVLGDLDGLRARADTGDHAAARKLAALLEKRGDPARAAQVLRARVDAGDRDAALQLAYLLRKRGDPDGLRAQAVAGNPWAAPELAALLVEKGQAEEAEQLHRFGLSPDGAIACA